MNKKIITAILLQISSFQIYAQTTQPQKIDFMVGSTVRSFYFLPPIGTPKGLIILMHGIGSNGNEMLSSSPQVINNLRNKGVAFAAPNALGSIPNNTSSGTAWNGGFTFDDCCFSLQTRKLNYQQKLANKPLYNTPKYPDDISTINTIAIQGSRILNIPTGKVAIVGASNGGILAQRLQCNLPKGSFGGVVSVVGSLSGISNCGEGAAPFYAAFNGELDTVVPYKGGSTSINGLGLYPEFIFNRTAKQSFNEIASKAGCLFGENGEFGQKSIIKASASSTSYATNLDAEVIKARCTSEKTYMMVTYLKGTHDSSDMLKNGIYAASESIGIR